MSFPSRSLAASLIDLSFIAFSRCALQIIHGQNKRASGKLGAESSLLHWAFINPVPDACAGTATRHGGLQLTNVCMECN